MSYPARGPASAGIDGKAIAARRRRANLRVTTMSSARKLQAEHPEVIYYGLFAG
jgi:hypothetical protein